MSPAFQKSRVDTYFDYLALIEGACVAFLFVHDSSDPANSATMLSQLPACEEGELYLDFDLAAQSRSGKAFLLDLPPFEIHFPGQVSPSTPFLRAFVRKIGFVDSAFDAVSASALVARARHEREQLMASGLLPKRD